MNKVQIKRLFLSGFISAVNPKIFEKKVYFTLSQKLEKEGWKEIGNGFYQIGKYVEVYKIYFMEELVVLDRKKAIKATDVNGYVKYGELIKKNFLKINGLTDEILDESFYYVPSPKTIHEVVYE